MRDIIAEIQKLIIQNQIRRIREMRIRHVIRRVLNLSVRADDTAGHNAFDPAVADRAAADKGQQLLILGGALRTGIALTVAAADNAADRHVAHRREIAGLDRFARVSRFGGSNVGVLHQTIAEGRIDLI